MSEELFSIAIDGPAGAGKSTIAKAVAKELGFIYVDTGAMYRAMAIHMLRSGLTYAQAAEDPAGFEKEVSAHCADADVSIQYVDGQQVVLLGGENVNPILRTEEVSNMASATSAVQAVRTRMVELQQELARRENVVMDGRDIGTVVLPDAKVKVYLTASVEERARRRYIEDLERFRNAPVGTLPKPDLKEIEEDIRVRDHRDMTREHSPLRQAEDAVLIDSSDMTIDQVAEAIMNLYAVKKNARR